MAAKRASKAKGKPKAGSRARRETAAEKRERLAREARNLRARERRAEKKREEERAARREAARKRKEAAKRAERREEKKRAQVAADETARLLVDSSKKGLRLAKRREADRRRREQKKREREGLPQERRRAGPPGHVDEPHPLATAESMSVAELVRKLWRSELSGIAAEVSGRSLTHLQSGTGEVTGQVWREAPDSLGDVEGVVAQFGDAYAPAQTGMFYGETYFQGFAMVVVAGGAKGKKKGGSPLDESRVGPDGRTYRTANTQWSWGDAQKCIYTLGAVIGRVMRGRGDVFSLVKFGIRQYWSPLGLRPRRDRKKGKRGA